MLNIITVKQGVRNVSHKGEFLSNYWTVNVLCLCAAPIQFFIVYIVTTLA